ncbi:cytochrome P450 3A29 [Caerostris extrusa]|uniref:Cytochrome P450 3A29 n=1 Tax=Caerostris extrusa TaxID=172846 RepID=A0AAV4RRZ0_CAEEX|nr:cytochrome P450 3A29 [Caerostris extrusa]
MFGFDIYIWISILITAFVGYCTSVYLYVSRNDNYWKKRGIPFVPRMNMIKLMYLANRKPTNEVWKQDIGKYGRAVGSYEWNNPRFLLSDPNLIRDVLVKDFHKFHYRKEAGGRNTISQNAITALQGEDWKRVRTIISPAFTSKRMRQMGSIINDCSKSTIEVLETNSKEGKPVELFAAFTMDVIARAAFGTQIDAHNDPENVFVKHVKENFAELNMLQVLLYALLLCGCYSN